MLGIATARPQRFSFVDRTDGRGEQTRSDRWSQLAKSAILVLGSPRSGTTWLAKIFDSHPEVLYRHEPDELSQVNPGREPAEQVAEWLRERGLRAAAKRPSFRKSWRPAPLDLMRRAMGAGLALARRVKPENNIGLPDMIMPGRWRLVRPVIKLVNWDASSVAGTMPDTRCVIILRHPCGQVASVMAGLAAKRFLRSEGRSDLLLGLTVASNWAGRHGVDQATFGALSDAAKLAWTWRAFNEPAVEGLRDLPNARIVIYEDLCRRPKGASRELFAFAGLGWAPSTEAFLTSSTQLDRPTDYFDVFRDTEVVADRWRQTMSQADQEAVRRVLCSSVLAGWWPDLMAREA
jgi:hypothetical protein